MDLLTNGSVESEVAAAIDRQVDRHAEWSFQFLERLVAAQSIVGQEQAALEVFAEQLDGLGFAVERLPIPDDIVELPGAGIPMAPYAGRYDVIARRTAGREGATLLLNGHIDVVPAAEPQLWTSPPSNQGEPMDGCMDEAPGT